MHQRRSLLILKVFTRILAKGELDLYAAQTVPVMFVCICSRLRQHRCSAAQTMLVRLQGGTLPAAGV